MEVILPRSPDDQEKFAYQNSRRYGLYVPGVLSGVILTVGMWLFVFAHPGFFLYGLFVAVMTFYLGISYFVGLLGRDFDFDMHNALLALNDRPASKIDVYLPCCGEPLEVLRNTYRHVKKLEWHGYVAVWVLDDKKNPDVMEMAAEFGFGYIARKNSGELKKAGNLRHAFKETCGEFIVIFDADFCPRPDFLKELMPYMADPKTAIVQSPQYFSVLDGQSWVEKGAGYIQELFYRVIQVSRDTFAASICVGSNAIYRRSALEPFGGTAPIAFSEDVHTGFMITNAGYRVRYIPLCLAKGMCPDQMAGFFVQQYRWATGSLSLFMNPEFWKSNLNVMQKLCYLSGMMYYLTTGLGCILTTLPAVILVWFAPDLVFWYNAVFSLPSFLYGMVLIPLWTNQPWGWYGARARIVCYHANLFALVDKLKGSLVPWQPTGAVKRVKRFEDFRHFLFWYTGIATSLILLGVGAQLDRFVEFSPMLFFTMFNAWLAFSVLREQ